MDRLIDKILEKKEIKLLDRKIIKRIVLKYFEKNKDIEKKFLKSCDNSKSKIFNFVLKKIRGEIEIIYSSFLKKDFSKKYDILNSNLENEKKVFEILKTHKSTFERIEFYKVVYDKIFSFFKVKKVIDICCGINPVSYYFLCDKNLSFECYDINKDDCNFLNLFFKKFKIKGTSKDFDIFFDYKKLKIKKSDLVFLFKTLDSLEFRKKDFSKDFLKSLNAKNLVISFSKKSLCLKKEIKDEKRNWLRNFFKKEKWDYFEFEISNEIFFLVSK